MLERLKTYLLYGNRYVGIEHCSKDGGTNFISTLLTSKKKELLIVNSHEARTQAELCEHLPKNLNVALTINTNKVLSKTIESQQQEALKLVYKAFPNITVDDFYYEVLTQENIQNPSSGKKHFVSLCRKTDVDAIIQDYTKAKIYVTAIHLGHHAIGAMLPFVKNALMYSSNASLELHQNTLVNITPSDVTSERYEINGLKVSNEQLLSFSSALATVLKIKKISTNYETKIKDLVDTFIQHRVFSLGIKVGGLIILGLLLINFFLFNYYFNEANDLQQVSEINKSTKTQIVSLKEKVIKKQTMVDDLLKSSGSQSSFYADRIIHSLPSSVLLSEFNYQPLSKRIKAEKPIELKNNRIQVSGVSNNSEVFNQWINDLDALNWINKVNIMDYGTTSANRSEFTINIELKP